MSGVGVYCVTMRSWLLLAALLTGTAACDAGGDSEASSSEASVALYHEDGRPLALPTDDPGVLGFEQELLKLVGDHRASLGLAPFKSSRSMADVARAHSRNMIGQRYFAHESPEGTSPGDRLGLAGVDWDNVGENLAAGTSFGTPQAVFDAWLASPGHRANLESEGYVYAGAGYAHDPEPSSEHPHVHHWTLLLLKP